MIQVKMWWKGLTRLEMSKLYKKHGENLSVLEFYNLYNPILHPDVLKGYADDNETYSFKGRSIDFEKPVLVYRNLNKGGYSIKQFGKVVAHSKALCLSDCTFIVRESGRKRVLETGHKNVHAFIKGLYRPNGMGTTAKRNDLPCKIVYNPFDKGYFYWDHFPNKPLKSALFLILDTQKVAGCYLFF